MDWYLKVLKNYVGFRGRARRKEYWMFILVNIIFTFVLGLLDKMLGWQRAGGEGILTTIYGILVFLPWWAVQFRRLHDTDRSAWWALLFLIPFIGWLIIIVFNCQAGTPGENRFGPDRSYPAFVRRKFAVLSRSGLARQYSPEYLSPRPVLPSHGCSSESPPS